MIATLSGKVLSKGVNRAVIDVGGVGYEVYVTTDGLARLPDREEPAFLYIHTHVREDAIVLYGFLEEEEKEMYLTLTTVSGVGPKLALAILSGMRVDDLCRAIGSQDIKRLTGLQGVGRKTAERICVDLKEKVAHLASGGDFGPAQVTGRPVPGMSSTVSDALSALSNLGYNDPICRQAMSMVKKQLGDEPFYALSVEELIRHCLRALA